MITYIPLFYCLGLPFLFQNFKATANYGEGKAMYDSLSKVSPTSPYGNFVEFRDIVVARKQPRKMFVQAHTEIKGRIIIMVCFGQLS